MSTNTEIVQQFISAWNAKDTDAIMSFFTEESVYHNIPVEPLAGLEAIKDTIHTFVGMAAKIDWVVHHIAENDAGAVLTERSDKFLVNDKWIEARVMGVFEIADGKITRWRDYFDMAQFQSQMAG